MGGGFLGAGCSIIGGGDVDVIFSVVKLNVKNKVLRRRWI